MIGPAVDEAAERFELSDGPLFWMAPSALAVNERYSATFFEKIEPTSMVRYAVPMNNGTTSLTLVDCHAGPSNAVADELAGDTAADP